MVPGNKLGKSQKEFPKNKVDPWGAALLWRCIRPILIRGFTVFLEYKELPQS